jgi:hypothetical protein
MEVRDEKNLYNTFFPMNQDNSNINFVSPPPIRNEILIPYRNELDQNSKTCEHLNLNLCIMAVYYSRRFNTSVYVAPMNGTALIWKDHWLHIYGFDQQYIERRMHSAYEFRSEFLNARPHSHDYTISCKDCKEVIRVGRHSPSLPIFMKVIIAIFFLCFFSILGFIIYKAVNFN